MFLSKKQIKDYQKDGVLIVKDIFKDWIKPLRKGFQKVLENPSKHGRENVDDNNGRFFEDYCNWDRIKEFKDCIFSSLGAQIVAEATNSKSIQIFHEHIFIKEPGTNKETPWHQDMPYYCVDGNDTGSFWIPLDEVDKENNLKLILGSHQWSKLIRPTKWSNNQSWYKENSCFMDLPKIEKFKNDILIPELNLGDAVLFNFKTVHSSTGNNTLKSRRAFSMRFIGDDVRYINRGGATSPPFDGINLKSGDLMREDWFPRIFNN
jgi:ectoine hydroxylase-related dioxygenase (phytanoyl-CoA dioxygenase family)